MFGRYEKHDNSTNEHKFYEIAPTANPSEVAVAWGRIDTKGSGQLVNRSEARERINKKERDSYSFVSSQVESPVIHTIANQAAAISGTSVRVNTSPVESEATRAQQAAREANEKSRAERKAKLEEFNMNDWLTR